jgi:pimeloyl-ACP methyl ester carboxylesterase
MSSTFCIRKFTSSLKPASAAATVALGLLSSLAPMAVIGVGGMAASGDASAVSCGTFDGKVCSGTAFQYSGGFNPAVGEYGGFGGAASCTASRTPVIFIHGNGDNSTSWDSPTFQVPGYTKAPLSVYQQFKAAGYKDCELFGVTYLSSTERSSTMVGLNYHQPSKFQILQNFIRKVKTYTGKTQVDLVTHSLGVSMAMATQTYYGDWGSVRRFVNIAGGLRGLDSCLWVGYANPYATTCGSENWYNSYIFGLYPSASLNPWTGASATKALSRSAISNPTVSFYTIYAGKHDEIMCATTSDYANCGNSPLLQAAANVKAQVNVGAGSNTQQLNWDWSTGSPWNVMGGDTDGVGHFHSKSNTGTIIVKMLSTTCTTGCAVDYKDIYGPAL